MEIILMVGISGTGKTTLSKKLFSEHTHISLDNISNHNRKHEFRLVRQELQKGNNIVVDDTNLTKNIRLSHINLAREFSAKITAVFLDIPI